MVNSILIPNKKISKYTLKDEQELLRIYSKVNNISNLQLAKEQLNIYLTKMDLIDSSVSWSINYNNNILHLINHLTLLFGRV